MNMFCEDHRSILNCSGHVQMSKVAVFFVEVLFIIDPNCKLKERSPVFPNFKGLDCKFVNSEQ